MCGILGVCLDNSRERTEDDLMNIRSAFTDILEESERRGRDASGMYIVNPDGVVFFKAPERASEMILTNEYWEFLDKHLTADTIALIGHTRAATTGSPSCNDNTHPIVATPIIGVHNGVIRNHEELGKSYKKCAEVDSAAIMSLLRVKSKKSPLKLTTLTKNLHELSGPFAIAVADVRKPDAIYMARNSNPVTFCRTGDGLLYFASTEEILKDGLECTYNINELPFGSMPANSACRIDPAGVRGEIKFSRLDPPKTTFSARSSGPPVYSVPRVRHMLPTVTKADICPNCKQVYTIAYMGEQEIRCCGCLTVKSLFDDPIKKAGETAWKKSSENRMAIQDMQEAPHPNLGKKKAGKKKEK